MGTITVQWIRGDSQTFTADGTLWGLVAASGLDEPNVEVYTQKAAVGDGDLITGRRIGSRTLEFTLKAKQAALGDVLRRAVTSFFVASQTYDIYVSRSGAKRYAADCQLESVEVPTENPYTPATVKLSFLLPEGYFLSADGFGQNIAGIESRCGYPYAALHGSGRIYGLYAYAQTVYLQNDGDAEAYCRAVMTARGTVTNPKLIAGDGYVRVIVTMHTGDVLIIDGKTKAVTINGHNAATLLDKASRFDGIVFATGVNGVGFTADIGSNLLDVFVFFNKRYLGA
ncbi:MAG: phage tail family protein [Eubacteriales bacterium]|nr:phage tail family protein [Eubacteriales bacterium]